LNGQKSLWGAFKSFLNSTLASINNMIAQTFAKQVFGGGSSGGGMLGGIFDKIMGSFAGGFASGGTIGQVSGAWSARTAPSSRSAVRTAQP
jgi:phage-related protein